MANEFKRNVGSKVSKADAKQWIDKFDKERKKDTKSVFYGRDAIMSILSNPSVTGISFFFCRKPKSDKTGDMDDLILVGTFEDGSLNLGESDTLTKLDDGQGTYENGLPCPTYCPQTII
jgi:hypothetical protein